MEPMVLFQMLVVVGVRVEATPERREGGRLPPAVGIETPAPRVEAEEVPGAMDVEAAGGAVQGLEPVLPDRIVRVQSRHDLLRRAAPAAIPLVLDHDRGPGQISGLF